jgi:hypothetical protein
MSKSQRTKGAVFEREVAKLFSAEFGREFKRNIGQARDGGNDLDVGILTVEAKRRASLDTLRGWLAQAGAAASARPGRPGTPIVVCREDGAVQPMVLLNLADFFILAGGSVRASLPATELPWKTIEGMC